jgi:hypothetical protein
VPAVDTSIIQRTDMTLHLLHVPAALLVLLDGLEGFSSVEDARHRLREMLPDLRDQARAHFISGADRQIAPVGPAEFDVHLHGAMDILSHEGCREATCRFALTRRIISSVGLVSDRIWLTDRLSPLFADFGRVTNEKLNDVVIDTLVLKHLVPLMQQGLIRFRSVWRSSCKSCSDDFNRRVAVTAQAVAQQFKGDVRVQICGQKSYEVHTGSCFVPEQIFGGALEKNKTAFPTSAQMAERFAGEQVRGALWTASEAALSGGSIFTNSRLGLAGLMHQEGRRYDGQALVMLDGERSFNVPWLSELLPEQVMELRQEAAKALPAFRDLLARSLSAPTAARTAESARITMLDLREQATAVRSELQVLQSRSASRWKTTYQLLGLGVCALGIASDELAAGALGLIPAIKPLFDHDPAHQAEVEKVIQRPGYVLVKAKDLLGHAH